MADEIIHVTYTVKELLQEINSKLSVVTDHLDRKADIKDVERLETRVDTLERESALLKDRSRQKEATFSKREKVLALFAAVAAVAVQYIHIKGIG
jgi:cell division protein FtsL